MNRNTSPQRQRWCGPGWGPRVGLCAQNRPPPSSQPAQPLPDPCGAVLDRIHFTRQHRIRAWRVSLGRCHLTPSLLSGVRPGSPRRLPSDTFITSCSRNRQSGPEPLLPKGTSDHPQGSPEAVLHSTQGLAFQGCMPGARRPAAAPAPGHLLPGLLAAPLSLQEPLVTAWRGHLAGTVSARKRCASDPSGRSGLRMTLKATVGLCARSAPTHTPHQPHQAAL